MLKKNHKAKKCINSSLTGKKVSKKNMMIFSVFGINLKCKQTIGKWKMKPEVL